MRHNVRASARGFVRSALKRLVRLPGLKGLYYSLRNAETFEDLPWHDFMLADHVRMSTYARAIDTLVPEGSVVVDVGTGSGVLACMAARRAHKVYAIEHSALLDRAKLLAASNGLTNVEFLRVHSREFSPPEKVDVLVHEQIGLNLIDEDMIANIGDLRRRILKDGGLILPGHFELRVVPVSLKNDARIPFLHEQRLHGLDFGAFAAVNKPEIAARGWDRRLIDPREVATAPSSAMCLETSDSTSRCRSRSRPTQQDGSGDTKSARRQRRPRNLDRRPRRFQLVTDISTPLPSSKMIELLNGFVVELRNAGLPVSLTENLDAMEAVQHIPIDDRDAFKYALGATLVKNNAHWRSFETVFEVYFSLRGPEYRLLDADEDEIDDMWREMQEQMRQGEGQAGAGGGMDSLTVEEIAQLLMQALLNGDQAMMRAMARQAVQRFAGMEPGRPVGGTYYLYRTLRNLDLDGMLDKLMDASRQETEEGLTSLEERLETEEFQDRIDQFKSEIEAEIRRRLVADRGAEAMAKTLRKPLPEDVEFMHASRDEMQLLRKALYPLTRKLAARLARKRRHGRKGPLDFRNTVRHSLSYGGVPAEPKFKYPRPAKPELVVVADISGSVAAFARFTLMLVYAIQNQFSKVRSFVFIDGIDEVTDYFKNTDDIQEAIHRVNTEADVVWVDGHSDYGHAFEVFWQKWGKEVGQKSTVLLLGDARNNYHASQSWVVKQMADKARHVYWLNPEPRSYWNTGDSIVGEYATHTDGVYECRNLRQLESFVEKLT